MRGILDSQSIDIPCENCGSKTAKTVGWIKTHSELTCACGTKIKIDASQFKREIGKVDASIDKLKRSLKAFNKR